MVSALGVNIQRTFGLAFVVGAALAGFGGVMGGSFAGLQTGVDGDWLLNSLIVVILGGMGSIGGAAVDAVLLGLRLQHLRRLPAHGRAATAAPSTPSCSPSRCSPRCSRCVPLGCSVGRDEPNGPR